MKWTSSIENKSTRRTDALSIGASDGCRKIRHPGIGASLSASGDQGKIKSRKSVAPIEPTMSSQA